MSTQRARPFAARSTAPSLAADLADLLRLPFPAYCDLIASGVNPNCSYFATTPDKLEIAGEFLLSFYPFGPTIGGEPGRFMDEETAPEPAKARTTGEVSWLEG